MGQAIESLRHVYENGVNIGRSTQRTVKVSYEFKCHISRNIGRGLLPKNLLKSPLDLYTSHWHNVSCHLANRQPNGFILIQTAKAPSPLTSIRRTAMFLLVASFAVSERVPLTQNMFRYLVPVYHSI